jgi:hypothetical protein
MITYNPTDLDHLHVQEQAHIAHQNKLITAAEEYAIKQAYPVGFYHPGLFARAGLFVLTVVISAFSLGLLCLMLAGTNLIDSPAWPVLLGAGLYFALELMVKHNHYYKAGIDDALLWLSGALVTGGVVWMLNKLNSYNNHEIAISAFICILSLVLTLRFANWLMGILLCLAGLSSMFFICREAGTLVSAALPFILMLTSSGLYMLGNWLNQHPQAVYYKDCLIAFRFTCLVGLYASGNYYLIAELQQQLSNGGVSTPHQVIFGFIFWVWTIMLPFIYTAWGIVKKDILLLRTGLLLLIAAILTVRNYYHVLPVEWALSTGGFLLLIIVYAVVRYLKTPKHGYTYAEQYLGNKADQINIESIITAATASQVPVNNPAPETSRFGGGSFGGGGSGSNF